MALGITVIGESVETSQVKTMEMEERLKTN